MPNLDKINFVSFRVNNDEIRVSIDGHFHLKMYFLRLQEGRHRPEIVDLKSYAFQLTGVWRRSGRRGKEDGLAGWEIEEIGGGKFFAPVTCGGVRKNDAVKLAGLGDLGGVEVD